MAGREDLVQDTVDRIMGILVFNLPMGESWRVKRLTPRTIFYNPEPGIVQHITVQDMDDVEAEIGEDQ